MHNLHIWQKIKKKKKHTLSPFMYGLVYNPLLKKKNTTTLLQNLLIHGIFQIEII